MPIGGVAPLPAYSFESRVGSRGASTLGSCDVPGAACAAPSPSGFSANRCIARAGSHACPDGYSQGLIYATEDQRGCTPCACGEVTGASCAPEAVFAADANC